MNWFVLLLAMDVFVGWTYRQEDITTYQVSGFTLYMGIQSVVQGNPPLRTWNVDAQERKVLVEGLDFGTTYYFATKVHGAGGDSVYSGELVYTPMPEPTPNPTPPPQPTPTPPQPTPTPLPTPEPTPVPTPDGPGKHKGWFK
jgi:hypothetical protein